MRQKREGAGPMSGTLHLAQAQSNRGPQGRKKDFADAERLVKRLVARELTLSFVPDAEHLWRTVMRRKHQLTRSRVQLQNRVECLLEEAHKCISRRFEPQDIGDRRSRSHGCGLLHCDTKEDLSFHRLTLEGASGDPVAGVQ
jgi:transposase